MLHVVAPAKMTVSRIILLGLGDAPHNELDCQDMGGAVFAALNGAGEKEVAWHIDAGGDNLPQIAADIAYGARLRSYRFDKYRTQEKPEQKPTLTKMAIVVDGATAARRDFKSLDSVAQGVFMTRELVSEPPNILYPASFAAEVKKLEKLGVKVEILNEKKWRWAWALLGVGQGSIRRARWYHDMERWTQ